MGHQGLLPLECESEASGLQVYRQAPVRSSGPPAGTMTRPKLGVLTGAAAGRDGSCRAERRSHLVLSPGSQAPNSKKPWRALPPSPVW